MNKTLLLLAFFSYFALSAQTFNSTDLRVTKDDLTLNTYEKDSTANALVLYEQGNSYFDRHDYVLTTKEKHKLKILNNQGFDHATIEVYLYSEKSDSDKEKIEDIIATTYNIENNEVIATKLSEENIYKTRYNEHYNKVTFTLPNVKAGSVITYSYTLISPFMWKYKGWEFQSSIPKLYSEYKASIPGNWLYHKKLIGSEKFAVNEVDIKKNCLTSFNGGKADCEESVYAMKNVPAFIEEDYMTTTDNYLARIEYVLKTFHSMDGVIKNYTKTWKDVDKEFKTEDGIGKQLRKKVNTEELLSQDILNNQNTLEKTQAIYKYVQNNYSWNNDYKLFSDFTIKELTKTKTGNVSAINILLHNLLDQTGINVKPVLLSTRSNGYPTKIFPVIDDFNYLIVKATINGKDYLLDATNKFLAFGELPYKCLNYYGRELDFKEGSNWVDIEPQSISRVMYSVNASINDNDEIIGKVKDKYTGYDAYFTRQSYFENKEEYVDELINNTPFLEIYNHETSTTGKTENTFAETYDFEYTIDDNTNLVYLNPFIIKFFKENPFKLQERSYPIELGYQRNYLYSFSIDLKDKYTVQELPKPTRLALPNNTGDVSFSAQQLGNKVLLNFKLSLNSVIYPAEYYPYLKEFMGKVVNIQKNSIIVLSKN
ncbi:DUF3857 domain-containing protein [Neotamlana laminarinivorans]|uniref:DUF3857 domain-containing protein n=1 Tax=Neotamlana laminarinivorans TaxID=2883124 RepID=A0A9X1I1Q4_9FLAO|nr:DUF3857 domain-containing protein [Tamlana laminarinivorans]MCB4800179.1 DUF3857 domain-containing protein [Tamlana laminarinivorans]